MKKTQIDTDFLDTDLHGLTLFFSSFLCDLCLAKARLRQGLRVLCEAPSPYFIEAKCEASFYEAKSRFSEVAGVAKKLCGYTS
ncbi:MAG: hypothetical protein ABSB91_03240 [Sedimentisphaerales bacterium]